MALYTVTNLTKGTVVLPPPIGIRLDKYETARVSAPAGMTEANLNRKYSAITKMIHSGLINVVTVEDQSDNDQRINDNVEVATVSMIKRNAGQYRAVASIAARDAIPASDRSEGMMVRTNDTDQYWVLEPDLLTWTLLTFAATVPVRTQIPLIGIQDGVNRSFTLPETFVHVVNGQSIDIFHNGRRLLRSDSGNPSGGEYEVVGGGGTGTGINFLAFAPMPLPRSLVRSTYVKA